MEYECARRAKRFPPLLDDEKEKMKISVKKIKILVKKCR
jgi:hypothetical protein